MSIFLAGRLLFPEFSTAESLIQLDYLAAWFIPCFAM